MTHQTHELQADRRSDFSHVLTELPVGGLTLRNRLFFPSMGVDLGNPDGTFSDALAEFYTRIARSGCGLVVLSNSSVSANSILQLHGLRLFEEQHAQALAGFMSQCRPEDALIAVQLQHYGGQANTIHTGKPVLTPSGIGSAPSMKKDRAYATKLMTLEDIEHVQAEFAQATRLAVRAGARFIQLQASNGYLLSSFLSPFTNQRTDRYGGSPQRRATFVAEVVRAVRAELTPQMALGLRININDCVGPDGLVVEQLRDVVPLLEEAGVDIFEASICVADTFSKLFDRTPEMEVFLLEQLRVFKQYASVPVGFAGFVDSLEKAEHYVASGIADTVGMARALFADNDLIIKSLAGRGDTVNRCLWDGNCFRDKSNPAFSRVYCCVNPLYKRPSLSQT
jgi:2,4-dienoyl-CoA reductase-like NADH-dependent reductase (Old Yellow Enzyme family)